MSANPNYPVYVISKGRAKTALTARFLIKDLVPFKLVVEPQEADLYRAEYGADCVLVLPFRNLGLGSIPARNWVWEHAKETGARRHWILDDNIRSIVRKYRKKRIDCNAGVALSITEDFVDRYENVAIGGLNYFMFGFGPQPPFYTNTHVYSCLLILNELNYRWRGRYNEDTDLCLQVLSGGWCTVSMNAFQIRKMTTMTMKGGNTESLYDGDGRLRMARSLERMWPYVVETKRRFNRPQHVIVDQWRRFDTQLKRRADIDFENIKEKHPMKLVRTGKIKSPLVQKLLDEYDGS